MFAKATEILTEAGILKAFAPFADLALVRGAVTVFVAIAEYAAFVTPFQRRRPRCDTVAMFIALAIFAETTVVEAVAVVVAIAKVADIALLRCAVTVVIARTKVVAFVTFIKCQEPFHILPGWGIVTSIVGAKGQDDDWRQSQKGEKHHHGSRRLSVQNRIHRHKWRQ